MTEKRKTLERNEETYRDFNPENYIPVEDSRKREEYIPFSKYQAVTEETAAEKESCGPLPATTDTTVKPTEANIFTEQTEQNTSVAAGTAAKRTSSRQRRLSLEEYRTTFLQVPRIEDRKPVFISGSIRDKLDRIVRTLGTRRMSVSGLLENLVVHHLEIYRDDLEQWRKL